MAESFSKRAIKNIYSFAAEKIYEPVVVRGAFRIFGGNLNDLVLEQGRRAKHVAKGGPILDMPVGTGYFTVQTARDYEGLVVGSDIASGMVREAHQVARGSGTQMVIVQADAHRLPFDDGTFEAILCSNGLQVIPDTQTALDELARVLSPTGTLFISVVAVPLSKVLPPSARDHLPAAMRSGSDLKGPLGRAGLEMEWIQRSRLAWLLEARHQHSA